MRNKRDQRRSAPNGVKLPALHADDDEVTLEVVRELTAEPKTDFNPHRG